MNASFPNFFNKILTGRLMNRMTKDIYNIDKEIPNKIANNFALFFGSLALFSQIFFMVNFQTYPIIFFNIIYTLIFAYFYRKSAREVSRLG